MKKDLRINLAKIIFLIICSAILGFHYIPNCVDKFSKEISGETKQTCIEVLDKKTKRIEDTGLTLEELADEDIDDYTISKSEIDGCYVFKFNKEIYEVSIFFDSEENIVSIEKKYPTGNGVRADTMFDLILGAIGLMASFIGIGLGILERGIIVEDRKRMKQKLEEWKQELEE